MKHKIVPYEETESPNTETHLAVDEKIKLGYREGQNPMVEGFAASSGVRPEVSASGGRINDDEKVDASNPDRVPDTIEEEIAGLADS